MATALTFIQKNNRQYENEQKELASKLHRIADCGADVDSMWSDLQAEDMQHLIDGVLTAGDVDCMIIEKVKLWGWKEVRHLLSGLPSGFNGTLFRLNGNGQLVAFDAYELSDAIHEAADSL